MRVEDNEIQNLRREVLVGALIAGVVSVMPAHADMLGYVRTEVETGSGVRIPFRLLVPVPDASR